MAKRPLTSLTLGSTMTPQGEGATPEAPPSAPPVSRAGPEPRTAMTYRPTTRVHDRLRHISFTTRRSMQDLVDEAVEAWLTKTD